MSDPSILERTSKYLAHPPTTVRSVTFLGKILVWYHGQLVSRTNDMERTAPLHDPTQNAASFCVSLQTALFMC